ncbi:MAG: hypothetical protein AVDCRST_MAG04-2937 [uncultured Acetobacteraceae bacterium]|uniref:PIN domain-containing protein n=1 Tax=uncultured Acetobacteraceae bacterium TaxID=169975 RepID=A0A6J4J774_9PROT|nr:MAG: hypothetical protein AVDCRST_MAG04-2937 [uncultured Acetobacteraceae bacterium]
MTPDDEGAPRRGRFGRARRGYRIYDSLIVASALEANCATLFSKGMQDGQMIEGRLTIRNRFQP